MGYTTDFYGSFDLDKPLSDEHRQYLADFNRSRRMSRDAEKAAALPDPVREAAGLPIGDEGAYYVGSADSNFGQARDSSIIDYNEAPEGQPGLWCQWVPNEDGTAIEWDGGEKFYNYIEWLQYLIEHFIHPWGYKLTGEVIWHGEDHEDTGKIVVTDNVIDVYDGEIGYKRRS